MVGVQQGRARIAILEFALPILNAFIVNGSVLPDKHHQCGFTHAAKQREVVLHKASMWHIYSAKDTNLILTPTPTPYYWSDDFPQDSLRPITEDDVATH